MSLFICVRKYFLQLQQLKHVSKKDDKNQLNERTSIKQRLKQFNNRSRDLRLKKSNKIHFTLRLDTQLKVLTPILVLGLNLMMKLLKLTN